MASARRKTYQPANTPRSRVHLYADVMVAILAGDVRAARLTERPDGRGFDYDELEEDNVKQRLR